MWRGGFGASPSRAVSQSLSGPRVLSRRLSGSRVPPLRGRGRRGAGSPRAFPSCTRRRSPFDRAGAFPIRSGFPPPRDGASAPAPSLPAPPRGFPSRRGPAGPGSPILPRVPLQLQPGPSALSSGPKTLGSPSSPSPARDWRQARGTPLSLCLFSPPLVSFNI
jgi:hypothetical protein